MGIKVASAGGCGGGALDGGGRGGTSEAGEAGSLEDEEGGGSGISTSLGGDEGWGGDLVLSYEGFPSSGVSYKAEGDAPADGVSGFCSKGSVGDFALLSS